MSLRTVASDDYDQRLEHVERSLGLLSKAMLRLGLYFFWYMYEHIPVYYTDRFGEYEAFTDGTGVYLSGRFFERDFNRQLFIVLHELLHIAYKHNSMMSSRLSTAKTTLERNVVSIVSNVVMDAVINRQVSNLLQGKGVQTYFVKNSYVDPDAVDQLIDEDVSKLGFSLGIDRLLYLINTGVVELRAHTTNNKPVNLSQVEVSDVLEREGLLLVEFVNKKTGREIRVLLRGDLSMSSPTREKGGSLGGYQTSKQQPGGGEKPEGGQCEKCKRIDSPKLVKEPLSKSEPTAADIDKIVRNAIDFDVAKRAVDQEKSAGAGFYMSAIYELLDATAKKPRWLDRLRMYVDDYLGKFKVYTWSRVNRRLPYVKPGYFKVDVPHVIVLLDTSGSMLSGDLEKALSEVLGLVDSFPDAKVTMYQWSSVCSLPMEIDRKFARSVGNYKKIPIVTGGTELEPALDKVLPTVTYRDLVVIMTDGYIFDIDKEEVQRKLKTMASRAAGVIFVTTSAVPKLPTGVEVIKIE